MNAGVERTAVVLFNLGGPDRPEAVKPFLFNLFYDPAILSVRNPLRWCLARFISSRRVPAALAIYERMGGSSPLLANTEAQAAALQDRLSDLGDVRTFIAMRYWQPRAEETVQRLKAFRPDRVVLLPLYPQYSLTSTGSSVEEWFKEADAAGLHASTRTVCCYPVLPGLVSTFAESVVDAIRKVSSTGPVKVLMSAHGLPERVIRNGDPYQWQVERTAEALQLAVTDALGSDTVIEWLVTYQSRATPEAWLKPDTEAEIKAAAAAGMAIIVVPIAFVSEHSETLVELDIEYAAIAEELGAAAYERIPTVDAGTAFIEALAEIVRGALRTSAKVCSATNSRICPVGFSACPNIVAGS